MNILITGGAGFIGSFLADKLVELGHNVRILDNLDPQVHLSLQKPEYLNKKAEFFFGDVRNIDDFKIALSDTEVVFHMAASVGVAQSQYQVKKYIDTNIGGVANLAEILVGGKHKIKKVIVPSSMTVYGEGGYECDNCGFFRPKIRTETQIREGFDIFCPKCGAETFPVPLPETARKQCENIYALSKNAQEDILMSVGKTYNIPTVAFRLFNVYGPRQSLSNPYTGVSAIFLSRLKNGRAPLIYEDGEQTRDFISVRDVVSACVLAMQKEEANFEVFNVGSGVPISIKKISEIISVLTKINIKPEITKKFRKGDIRHCFADMSKIKQKIGFEPKISFAEGMKELVEWSKGQLAEDKMEQVEKELKEKGIV